jgi:CRP-like cAMP-binding protein
MINKNDKPDYSNMSKPLFPRWFNGELHDMFSETELFKGSDQIYKQAQVRKYQAGSFIFTPETSTCEKIYVLREGRIEIFRLLSSGKRLATGEIQPGIVFGIKGILGRTAQNNFAQAVEDCVVMIIPKEQFIKYLSMSPVLSIHLLKSAYRLINILEDRLVDTIYNSVRSRLANFLLNNIDQKSGIIKNFTQEEIGDIVGATRQVVTESLSQMRKEGLLITNRREIKVINRRGLAEILANSDA